MNTPHASPFGGMVVVSAAEITSGTFPAQGEAHRECPMFSASGHHKRFLLEPSSPLARIYVYRGLSSEHLCAQRQEER
jgi:hypothetical protein